MAVKRSTIKEMDVLKAILSRYVMEGMTKGRKWSEAVENGVFFAVIAKMKENLDFWDHPVQTRVVNVSAEEKEKKDAEKTAQKDTFF